MSVSVDKVREDFLGDDASTSFPTGIPVSATGEIVVYDLDATVDPATSTLLVAGVDYTETLLTPDTLPSFVTVDVSLLYPGGFPSDHTLAVARNPELLNAETFTPTDRFPASAVALILDKVVLQTQVAKWLAERAIRAPIGDLDAEVILELPIASERAGKLLTFDSLGDLAMTEDGIATGTVPVSSFGETLVLAADASAARAILGIEADPLAYQVFTF